MLGSIKLPIAFKAVSQSGMLVVHMYIIVRHEQYVQKNNTASILSCILTVNLAKLTMY